MITKRECLLCMQQIEYYIDTNEPFKRLKCWGDCNPFHRRVPRCKDILFIPIFEEEKEKIMNEDKNIEILIEEEKCECHACGKIGKWFKQIWLAHLCQHFISLCPECEIEFKQVLKG